MPTFPPQSTDAIGEEDQYTSNYFGEEDTTQAIGEEGLTTDALGEEGDPWPPIEESVSGPFGGF
jgi:hypothetical protein